MAAGARSRGVRVSMRLVAIVLIPVLGLVGFTVRDASARRDVATGAAALADDVDRVSTLMPVALMEAREMYLQGAIVSGRELGLDLDSIGDILGVDLERALADARAEVDHRLARLDANDPALRVVADLHDLRARLDAGTVALAESDLWNVSRQLSEIAHQGLTAAQGRTSGLVESTRSQDALSALDAAYDAAFAVFEQIGALGRMVVTADDHPLVDELFRATARREDAEAELRRLASGSTAARLRDVEVDPSVIAGADSVRDVLEAGGLQTSAPAELAQLFGTAMDRLDAYYSLVVTAAADASAAARDLGADARARALLSLAITALLVLATILATALIARSIGRPLRRLADGAGNVRAGVLDDVDLPVHGPREVVAVSRTLREVVQNLKVVEAQLGALEAGDLDDPILDRPVPGRIGESLHGSVARLSRSLQEREELAAQLEHEATHDALTGLPNRSAAARELGRALARARRAGDTVAVLFVDLDDFKRVNDNHGHDAGDAVLCIIGDRLLSTVRAGDFVARLGGDEFLIISEHADDPRGLVELGERIVSKVAETFALGSVRTRVGASVGIALSSDLSNDADGLLRDADLAAYQAKANGRGRVEIFDDALRASLHHQADVERSLREALVNGELELYFQPVASSSGGQITALEALLRWNRGGQIVMPGEFIPIAESSDLIIDVGRWVLGKACEHVATWEDDPVLGGLPVAVNVSGRHVLSLAVVDDVRRVLTEWNVDAERLIIEVTETALVTDLPLIGEHLATLRAMGVRVSLDDFGTGYTSLSHLRSLPVDVLKIDRSLVVSGEVAPDLHILQLLVGTAHMLGMELVAEGIESPEQLERMHALGCDQMQGFLISRPMPASALRDVVARQIAGEGLATAAG